VMSNAPAQTVPQVARRWACSTRHVYALIAEGRLGHIRVGCLIRVRQIDIDAYEAAHWHAPASIDQPSALPAAPVPDGTSTGGGTANISAFRQGQRIAAKQRASSLP
jgi:excisionase family DNA binding protein